MFLTILQSEILGFFVHFELSTLESERVKECFCYSLLVIAQTDEVLLTCFVIVTGSENVINEFMFFTFVLTANDILRDSEPGSFIIRDSQSFPGAFGLAVKVAVPPAHVLQGLQGDLSKLNLQDDIKP